METMMKILLRIRKRRFWETFVKKKSLENAKDKLKMKGRKENTVKHT